MHVIELRVMVSICYPLAVIFLCYVPLSHMLSPIHTGDYSRRKRW